MITFSDLIKLNTVQHVADRHPAFLTKPFYVYRLERNVVGVKWTGFDARFNELQRVPFYSILIQDSHGLADEVRLEENRKSMVFDQLLPGMKYLFTLRYPASNAYVEIGSLSVTTYD